MSPTTQRERENARAALDGMTGVLDAFDDTSANSWWGRRSIRQRGLLRIAAAWGFIALAGLTVFITGRTHHQDRGSNLDNLIALVFLVSPLMIGFSLHIWGLVSAISGRQWDDLPQGWRYAALIVGIPALVALAIGGVITADRIVSRH